MLVEDVGRNISYWRGGNFSDALIRTSLRT